MSKSYKYDMCCQCGEFMNPVYFTEPVAGVICGHCAAINKRLCERYHAEEITMSRAAELAGITVAAFRFNVWIPWLKRRGLVPA